MRLLEIWTVSVCFYWIILPSCAEKAFRNGSLTKETFICANGLRIGREKLCNGEDDCKDGFGSDECECADNARKNASRVCEKWELYKQIFRRNDVNNSAVEKNEERLTGCILRGDLVDCTDPESLRCEDGTHCIRKASFCDGNACCPDDSDERMAGFGMKCALKGSKSTNACILPDNDSEQCAFGLENCFLTTTKSDKSCFQCLNGEHVLLPGQVCNGVPDCSDFSDECLCEENRIGDLCATIYNSAVAPESICTYSEGDVSCGDGTCIHKDQVCDGSEDCSNGIDEKFCIIKQTAKGYILCNQTNSTDNNTRLINAAMCDGLLECDDKGDECSNLCTTGDETPPPFCREDAWLQDKVCQNHPADSFSSEQEMLSNAPLRWILWIGGLLAFLGNAVVFIFTSYVMVAKKELMHTIAKCHHTLVLHLSIADFLMSVYLLAVAIQGTRFSGHYCSEDVGWRSSMFCAAMGALVIISSEMSVLIMLIMAAFRFASVYRPLRTYGSCWSVRIVRSSIAAAWVVSILVGTVPLLEPLQLYFTSEAWVQCPVFPSDFAEIDSMVNLATKIQTYATRDGAVNASSLPQNIARLSDVEKIYQRLCPRPGQPRWFGFYGQNSVCLPKLFTNTGAAAWEYSIAVIAFNVLAFCLMLVTYVLIVKVSFKSSDRLKESTGQPHKKCDVPKCKLQGRVTRLLVTDFVCWIPICIVSFVYLAGVPVSQTVFAVCGVVLLPLNSALNPLLYSGVFDLLVHKITGRRSLMAESTESTELHRKSTRIIMQA